MPSLSNVLTSIPGYAGYAAARQLGQEREMGAMQQAGALVNLQQALREREQEQAFRADLASLGPDATQEQLAQIAAKYAKPGEVLRTQQSSLDRQAALAASREAAQARIEAQKANMDMVHEYRLSQARTAEERAAETARHNRAMEGIQRQLAQIRTSASERPKPPAGYRYTADGNMEAIPGGPADTKLQGVLNQDTQTLSSTTAGLDRLATAANEVMKHPGLGGITGISGMFPNVPGGAAANAKSKLETLKAQVGFGVLQEMRNASKTGGALGSITEKELTYLQNALASLDQAQSEDQIKESLRKIIEFTEQSKGRLREAFNMKHGEKGGAAAPAPAGPAAGGVREFATEAEAAAANLPSGTRVKIGGKLGTWR